MCITLTPFHQCVATEIEDYIPITQSVEFLPGEMEKAVTVQIIDDTKKPVVEGIEKFTLYLDEPLKAVTGNPDITTISISDAKEDGNIFFGDEIDSSNVVFNYFPIGPVVKFKHTTQSVTEKSGLASISVIRDGDIKNPATVICYTKQLTALENQDFKPRRVTDESVVSFEAGVNVFHM